MNKIGDYLRELRTRKGLTIKEVRRRSGNKISQSYITYIDRGDKTPSVAKLEVFADVYGVSIHDLIDVMVGRKKKGKKYIAELTKQEMNLIEHVRKLSDKKKRILFNLVSVLSE